jgi:hypothetical protein
MLMSAADPAVAAAVGTLGVGSLLSYIVTCKEDRYALSDAFRAARNIKVNIYTMSNIDARLPRNFPENLMHDIGLEYLIDLISW